MDISIYGVSYDTEHSELISVNINVVNKSPAELSKYFGAVESMMLTEDHRAMLFSARARHTPALPAAAAVGRSSAGVSPPCPSLPLRRAPPEADGEVAALRPDTAATRRRGVVVVVALGRRRGGGGGVWRGPSAVICHRVGGGGG